MSLETHITEIIEGKRLKMFRPLLRALSWAYGGITELRGWAYEKGWLSQEELTASVISVGSIVAGGTGKTPFVALLASSLGREGEVAVVTRGYRADGARCGGVLPLHQLPTDDMNAKWCGDEPLLLQRKLPLASVWVGRKREQVAKQAIADGAELIILDDGMQRRSLARDIEIVLLDGNELFGKDFFLPRGFLREKPKELRRADWIVVSHIEDEEDYREVQKSLLPYTDAPIIGLGREIVPPIPLEGKKVGLIAAIAKPHRFEKSIVDEGAEVVDRFWKDDHKLFYPEELLIAADRAKKNGAELLLCSEKDGIKLPEVDLPLPLQIVRESLSIPFGEEHWNDLLARGKELIEKTRI